MSSRPAGATGDTGSKQTKFPWVLITTQVCHSLPSVIEVCFPPSRHWQSGKRLKLFLHLPPVTLPAIFVLHLLPGVGTSSSDSKQKESTKGATSSPGNPVRSNPPWEEKANSAHTALSPSCKFAQRRCEGGGGVKGRGGASRIARGQGLENEVKTRKRGRRVAQRVYTPDTSARPSAQRPGRHRGC